ncbi:MAG: polyphosphate kinase 2 family protein [Bdellovibrionales bacterium]
MPQINCLSTLMAQKRAQNYFLKKEDYEDQLLSAQTQLLSVQQSNYRKRGKIIIVLEGCDTAGKGGLARRMAQYLDPRTFHVHGIGKPNLEELEQHYLQRFFARLPRKGEISVFDRSWYGRVLVERVEKIALESEWRRAYREIKSFENMLIDDGILVLKYFLDISHQEQGKRFRERESDPLKSWKMTDEDYRNRKKWDAYQLAFKQMVKKTSTQDSPWVVIPADSKWYVRVKILEDIVKRGQRHLKKSRA